MLDDNKVAVLYHAALPPRAKADSPMGWPAPELATWGLALLAAAVAPVPAAALPMRWTRWPSVKAPDDGEPHCGDWRDLCACLAEWAELRVASKSAAPPWAPGHFAGGRRAGDSALAMYALALDCDDRGDWCELLAALDGAGLAYLVHRSPSHRDDGGPCKWRLVLPLAAPFDLTVEGAGDRWRDAYHAARLALGAVGSCWFDHTCADPGRGWFPPVAVGDAPPRELRTAEGRALDLAALLHHRPAPPAQPLRELPRPGPRAPGGVAGDPVERARRWIAKRDPAVQGNGGDSWTFATVAQLVNDFDLTDEQSMDVLAPWNAGCQPPWSEAQLRAKLSSARRSGSHAKGAAGRADRRWPADIRSPSVHGNDVPAAEGDDNGEPLALAVEALGWLDTDPPPLPRLLSCDAGDGTHAPFLALGKVAMLASPGGVGKTQALLQLAIAVASGRPWLTRYRVDAPGPVLVLAAEEDAGEMHRRVRRVVDALRLDPAERAAVARRLHVAPLHGSGTPLALLDNLASFGPAQLVHSEIWQRIALTLASPPNGELWRLVILDPAARWMPPEAELDSKVATTFVEALERLAHLAPEGERPAVLVAHHTNKGALKGDTDQGAARGSSALTDGVRWQANLDRVTLDGVLQPGRVRLRVVKCNYAPSAAFEALELSRDQAAGGVLVPTDPSDLADETSVEVGGQGSVNRLRETVTQRTAEAKQAAVLAREALDKLAAHRRDPATGDEGAAILRELQKAVERAQRKAEATRCGVALMQARLDAAEAGDKAQPRGPTGRDKAATRDDDL